jgi:hypothetical protein
MNGATEATLAELLREAQKQNANMEQLLKLMGSAGGSGGAGGGIQGLGRSATAASSALSTLANTASNILSGAFNMLTNVLGKVVTGFTDTLKNLYDFAKASAMGTARLSDFYNAFKDLPFFIGSLASIFADMVRYSEQLLDMYRDLTKAGASFGGDLFEMRNAAARAHLSMGEFAAVINSNSQMFATMSGNVQKGINFFVDSQEKLMGPGSPYAKSILGLGLTAGEAANYLTTMMAAQGSMANRSKMTADQLAKQTNDYIVELDTLSKLTGIRREQIDAEVKATEADQVFQRFLDSLSPEQAAKANTLIAQAFATGGKGAKEQMMASLRGVDVPLTDAAKQFAVASQGASLQQYAKMRELMNDQSVSNEELKKRGLRSQAEVSQSILAFTDKMGPQLQAVLGSMVPQEALKFARSIKKLTDTGMNLDQAIATIQKQQKTQAQGGAAALALAEQNIKNFGNMIMVLFNTVLGPVMSRLTEWGNKLTEWLMTSPEKMEAPVKKITEFLDKIFFPQLEKIGAWFGVTFKQLIGSQNIDEFWKNFNTRMADGWKNIKEVLGPPFRALWDSVKPELITGLKSMFEIMLDMIGDWVYEKTGLGELSKDRKERESALQTENYKKWEEAIKRSTDVFGATGQFNRGIVKNGDDKEKYQLYKQQISEGKWFSPDLRNNQMDTRRLDNRDFGTLGVTGNLFEKKSGPVNIQEGETVMTPDQVQKLVQNASASGGGANSGLIDELRRLNNQTADVLKYIKDTAENTRKTVDATRGLNGNLFPI